MADVTELTRDQLLAAAKTAKVGSAPLNVPELGGRIWVRGMTAKGRDKFDESLRIRYGKRIGQNDLRNYRAKLAARVIVDKQGQRLLNDSEEDITTLANLGMSVLDRIINKSTELSGQSEDEIEELGNGSASAEASDDSV